ncbi:MAG: type II toxin-antitoxin system VapC family toxin, partial [Thermofilaceae archaeon]
MKVFLDANLLIYLNAMADEVLRARYEDFYLRLLSEHRLYTDALVLDEVLFVSRKKYGVPYQVTLSFIKSFVKPFVQLLRIGLEEYEEAEEIIRLYEIRPSDALHLAVMKVNGIGRIVSEDRELDKVGWVKRL